MALITCPKCGKQFSDRAEKCPQCGTSKEDVQRLIAEKEAQEAAERERIRKEREAKKAAEAPKRKELWRTLLYILAICLIFCIGLIFF